MGAALIVSKVYTLAKPVHPCKLLILLNNQLGGDGKW
jgi:hypothetical protein